MPARATESSGEEARHSSRLPTRLFLVRKRLRTLSLWTRRLTRLAAIDPRKSQVVELRFFGGLTNDEMAEVLKVSPTTVMRDWSMAQAWLRRELSNAHDA